MVRCTPGCSRASRASTVLRLSVEERLRAELDLKHRMGSACTSLICSLLYSYEQKFLPLFHIGGHQKLSHT